ncbi:MAG: DUF6923 family protein [Niabella sp.]
MSIAKAGSNGAATNHTIYTTTNIAAGNSYTTGAAVNAPANTNVNGIGFNPQDRFLYGIGTPATDATPTVVSDNSSLYRIGADGTVINLGLLPVTGNGYAGVEFVNFSAGTMKNNGSFVYNTIAIKQSGVNKILYAQATSTPLNLTTDDIRIFIAEINNVSGINAGAMPVAPSTYYEIDFSDTRVTQAFQAFLNQVNNQYPNVSSVDGGIQDFDINPVTGSMYGYLSYPDPNPSGAATDVVGFPVIFGSVSSGIASLTPVGTATNENPDMEVAGLAFDDNGKFYGLFTSGEYAEINLTTGATENIVVSNIPTADFMGQNNLRGDLARGVPATFLAAHFGVIEAYIQNGVLYINWNTISETNSDHFDIMLSKDGKNFTKTGTVISKEDNGNSQNSLVYEFSTSAAATSFAAISLLALLGLASIGKKRYKTVIATCWIVASVAVFISCNKNDSVITDAGAQKIFVKIVEVDKAGNLTESKLVQAIYK